ncbi:MAG: hypothetical protein WCW16_02810 [Candidatus Magasanikbacteria bacterium]
MQLLGDLGRKTRHHIRVKPDRTIYINLNLKCKINDNALVALSLLIAVSDPKEKDKMIKIVTNLLV